MKKYSIDELAQPIGGLMPKAYYLPVLPGEPKYSTFGSNVGDMSQIGTLMGHSNGFPMELSGAGGDIDPEIAEFKAFAETLERYCNAFYKDEQFIWASANELGENALDLDTLPVCSDDEINNPHCRLIKPNKNEKIRWVKGISLNLKKPIWIPAIMTYLYIPYQSSHEMFHLPISTGTATHTSYSQALINGINEVIERDAIALTWLHKIAWPKLTIDESKLPNWAKSFYLQNENNGHINTFYFNATTDIGIPTIYSVQYAPHNDKLGTVVMCTTDLDPLQAFTKITREASSVRYALQHAKPRTDNINLFHDVFDGAQYMGGPDKFKEFDFLHQSNEKVWLHELKSFAKKTPSEELSFLLKTLKEKGLEVYAVDISTDESLRTGFYTVKVIIPGLMPLSFVHRARYLGHKRLYEAAINLGLGSRKEEDINPNPQPFA